MIIITRARRPAPGQPESPRAPLGRAPEGPLEGFATSCFHLLPGIFFNTVEFHWFSQNSSIFFDFNAVSQCFLPFWGKNRGTHIAMCDFVSRISTSASISGNVHTRVSVSIYHSRLEVLPDSSQAFVGVPS